MGKPRNKFVGGRYGPRLIVQDFGEEAGLIEEAVLVLRVFSLGDLVLLERFLRLPDKTKAIAEIGVHIGIVGVAERIRATVRDRRYKSESMMRVMRFVRTATAQIQKAKECENNSGNDVEPARVIP